MSRLTPETQVVVVGGGIAGLICAATLAKSGRAVTLLDAGARLGGRASTTEHDGYLLNEGAHALYASSARVLAGVGVKAKGNRPKLGNACVLRGGELLPAPFTAGALVRKGGPLSARQRAQYMKGLAAAATAKPARLAGISSEQWIAAHASTPLVSDLLSGLVRVSSYCGELSALSAGIGVGLLGEASRQPVRYVDGGWQSIVEELADRARQQGAQLRSGARVEGLLAEDRVIGVRLNDGEEISAHTVVLAGLSPTRAGRLLSAAGGGLPETVNEPHLVRAACLDVALTELPRPDRPFVLGLDEPLYLSVHSLWSKLTPPGRGAVVQLLRYDDGTEISAEAVQARLETMLDQAQPGWRERVIHQRFAPRMIAESHLPTPAEGLASRPGVADTGLDGVFIAGDWVGPRGWLAGASLHSGEAAARAVVQAGEVVGETSASVSVPS